MFVQTKLPGEERDVLLVDTFPATRVHKNPDNLINIGLEYAATAMNADVIHWKETVDISKYRLIGFNVMYLTYTLNIAPFLRRHKVGILRDERDSHEIIVGGPGATNINNALGNIVDSTFYGEIDGHFHDDSGFHRSLVIDSPAVMKGSGAVVEIARGCKHRCTFCEYGHVLGGRYREKDIELVKSQVLQCSKRTKNITLRTANLAGYSELDELLGFCVKHKISQRWSDVAILDAEKILPWMKALHLYTPKIGVESFDEATRKAVGKGFDDEYLEEILKEVLSKCSTIHLYLIYGLPNDNYENWFLWAERLAKLREQFSHKIRIDFSITNFSPCPGTPLSHAPQIDFAKKAKFLERWVTTLKSLGFYKADWEVKPGNDFGRFGRKQLSHEMTELIRTAGPEILTGKLTESLPFGVERSIIDRYAKRFLEYNGETMRGNIVRDRE